jgi:anti-sigma factor RsiW
MTRANTIMDRMTPPPLTEEEIHALVDGQVAPDALASIQERLANDQVAQATVQQWQQQREALGQLQQDVLQAPIPPTLMKAAQRTFAAHQVIHRWWRWGGMAAAVVLVFGMGWTSNSVWHRDARAPSQLAKGRLAQDFARQASFAHGVYLPEVRHPVEVTAAEQDHLVQWLSKRVGKPLKVPNLAPQGFELVGGRLLPGEAGARAQFMFQNTTGTRLTLYLGTVEKAPAGADVRETGFQFSADGPIPSFYWIDHGFGYALAGQVPRDTLMKLAEAVYRQL